MVIGAKSGPDGRCEMYRKRNGANTKGYKLDNPETLDLYEQGLNDRQIAKILGCSQFTVFEWRKRHGLKPNGRNKKEKHNEND